MTLALSSILVRDRQRTDLVLDDNFVASVARRLIHPIVIRREGDSTILVAGGKRLAALEKAGIVELEENTHFRYMDDLSAAEAKTIELEENIKRSNLSWRDHAKAVGEIDSLYAATNENWTQEKTAKELSLSVFHLRYILSVYRNLASPLLKDAQTLDQAYTILQNAAARSAASIVNDLAAAGTAIFSNGGNANEGSIGNNPNGDGSVVLPTSSPTDSNIGGDSVGNSSNRDLGTPAITLSTSASTSPVSPPSSQAPIVVVDFNTWIKTYSGPKFTFIHCDFPFGIGVFDGTGMKPTSLGEDYDDDSGSDIFWTLLDSLLHNLDRVASYSSHLMLWFSMNHYERLRLRLLESGLFVLNHPLVWHKTDNTGMVPGRDNRPRQVYETAMLASRGQRALIKKTGNAYGAPTATNPIHPSQKPEPVLRHFFQMLIDETTDVFDPTAGSGSALRAAEDCGAKSISGLELNPRFAEAANAQIAFARNLRERNKS